MIRWNEGLDRIIQNDYALLYFKFVSIDSCNRIAYLNLILIRTLKLKVFRSILSSLYTFYHCCTLSIHPCGVASCFKVVFIIQQRTNRFLLQPLIVVTTLNFIDLW